MVVNSRLERLMAVFLNEADVARLLDPDALLQAVRQALVALSQGRVVQPLRMVMPMADPQAQQMPTAADAPGLLFVKPSQVGAALATKLLTLVPGNAQRGLPTLLATVVLMDPVTGQTQAVMEGAGLTAARTAAASAVAATRAPMPLRGAAKTGLSADTGGAFGRRRAASRRLRPPAASSASWGMAAREKRSVSAA